MEEFCKECAGESIFKLTLTIDGQEGNHPQEESKETPMNEIWVKMLGKHLAGDFQSFKV